MVDKLFSFKHITSHPAIVNPNILRVIKYGEDENFETHYVFITDFNRYNADQPQSGVEFQKWLDQKAQGHPVILVDGYRVKELLVSEDNFKAIISNKQGEFKEFDLTSATSVEVTTAFGLKEKLKSLFLQEQMRLLETQVAQLIADL